MGSLKNIGRDIIYGNGITLAVRLCMGVLFLYSGILKAIDPVMFSMVIAAYDILPNELVPYCAIVIPYLELLIGLFLIVGFKVRASALISFTLMIIFIVFISINIIRGRTFECGCFKLEMFGLEISSSIGWKLLIRDFVFLIVLVILLTAERHLLSIENFIEKRGLEGI